MSIAGLDSAFLDPGKTSNIFHFFIFCFMFILEGRCVTTIKGCWLEFGDTFHIQNSFLSSRSFSKITYVLSRLLSVTFISIT